VCHEGSNGAGVAGAGAGFGGVRGRVDRRQRRYGYHRDELYFLAIGGHPAFGYDDQPPLVPLLAHAMEAVSGHSLIWLRVPPALAGALIVFVTGLIAREFGARRGAQLLAAATIAVSAILVSASHLDTTTIFDLLIWTDLSLLIIRALGGQDKAWLLVGVIAGIGLEIKTLPIFFLFAVAVGLLLVGPRQVFASRMLWAGTAIAVALWAPNLIWQASHGWPQLHLSAAIASGSSGTSQPRWLFVPYQGVLISPVLVPVWIAGLWRLARARQLRTWRAFAVAFALLVVVFVAVGGKPYYLCGMYPVLLAAGSEPTLRWVQRRATRARAVILGAAIALSAAVSAVLMLPIVPVSVLHDTPIVAINYDAGEQVGWPAFAATVAHAYRSIPPAQRRYAVVIAANYGEAGAMHRYRRTIPTYGGQNSYWNLAAPPADTRTAVIVGYSQTTLRGWFATASPIATINNEVDLNNDEQGEQLWLCTGPTAAWATLWARPATWADDLQVQVARLK